MPRFNVCVERAITETTSVTVTAPDLESARSAALVKIERNPERHDWTADDEWAGGPDVYAVMQRGQVVWER